MGLVSKKDILSLNTKLKYFGGSALAGLIMRLLKLHEINDVYDSVKDKKGLDGLKAILDRVGVNYEICPEDLKNIPEKGAFITVSNHPFGGADGVILARIVAEKRPDYKLLVNFLLNRIENVNEFFLPVNPFESRPEAGSSFSGMRKAFAYLKEGKPLGFFPAGEVSTYQKKSKGIIDRQWQPAVMRLIQKAAVPVVPIYFEGSNSSMFHKLGKIHPSMRTIMLPREFLNVGKKKIQIRIGKPITPKEQIELPDLKDYTAMLRLKTYSLGFSYEEKMPEKVKPAVQEKVIDPQPIEALLKEIASIPKEGFLFKVKTYSVYYTPSSKMPLLMKEIGRLREITFREVGEGTNKSYDLDQYDSYFNQLFIWDDENNQMVGAYRIGSVRDIIREKGMDGLYINSLFKIDDKLIPILNETLELGRSFVVKSYQRKATPLYLLWKALLYLLIKYDYRYLIGPVSISGEFSYIAKALTMEFLKANFFNKEFSGYVTNREKLDLILDEDFDLDTFLKITKGDFSLLDRFIQNIEKGFNTPILVRQYINMLNTKTIGFNIDPHFNYCLDALMIMDVNQANFKTIDNLSKDFEEQDKVKALLKRIKESEA